MYGWAATAEECLSKAQKYLALAENTSNEKQRQEYLQLAQALTEFAAELDTQPKSAANTDSIAQR